MIREALLELTQWLIQDDALIHFRSRAVYLDFDREAHSLENNSRSAGAEVLVE